ncbi:chromate transporter [Mycoplasma sp. 21DD0573]|uniref:chromate transporter n=1 Tax=Mycoplasma sp. 21DD0573 TaxID=3108525 RepID=UPI002B1D2890|nr:chromate transporter [Mycoplasma sp. 21DD0573]MEA4276626.1 chromate transporter [Mycoplasma sp. 21DD0573]
MNKNKKKVSFWELFSFIIKVTFIGFGGGNALLPVIKKEAVDNKKWITNEEMDDIVIVTNMLPGASVIQTLSYISISLLGKFKGTLVTLLGILPHVIFAFIFLVILTKYIPSEYLKIISVGVLVSIIAFLIAFAQRYIKQSKQSLKLPVWLIIMLFSICVSLFVPSPYNLPIFSIVIFLFVFAIVFLVNKKHFINKQSLNKSLEENGITFIKKGGK